MKILADENIPYVREAFAGLGEVQTMAGRAMDAERVRDADILLVRSITKVGQALLDGSGVRFVATATIGEDHIDKDYLSRAGIGFSSAPGCNANSVGQYITAALLVLAHWREFRCTNKVLGIVGHGNVGKIVEKKATALGFKCILNDPPLQRETGDARYRPLEEILTECDIITVHVPLTREGPDATYHMLDAAFFDRVKTGAVIINSARGPVADNAALKEALEDGKVGACVLDVWEGEPAVDMGLLANVAIATPHIAGYSFDGKVNGTRQIYEAACRFLEREPAWDPAPLLPPPECPEVRVAGGADDLQEVIRKAVLAVYDIREDDKAMRGLIQTADDQRAAYFDMLRKEYPRRREFFNTRAVVAPPNQGLSDCLAGIGYNLT